MCAGMVITVNTTFYILGTVKYHTRMKSHSVCRKQTGLPQLVILLRVLLEMSRPVCICDQCSTDGMPKDTPRIGKVSVVCQERPSPVSYSFTTLSPSELCL